MGAPKTKIIDGKTYKVNRTYGNKKQAHKFAKDLRNAGGRYACVVQTSYSKKNPRYTIYWRLKK